MLKGRCGFILHHRFAVLHQMVTKSERNGIRISNNPLHESSIRSSCGKRSGELVQSQMATLVEYSKSSTALCRNPQCGHSSRNILKGTIRFKVPDLGFTHLECLPSGLSISAQNLDGLSKLKQEDRHAVEAHLKPQTPHKSPGNVRNEHKPFLTLLQNVLDTVTKATNVVSTQGDQVACAVLLQDLQSICQSQHASHPFGSPIAQVSLDGSTPHTVSTLSSRNSAPHSVQSAQSAQSAQSVQSVQSVASAQSGRSMDSTHSTSTPAQEASLSAALLGAESADRSQRAPTQQDSDSSKIRNLSRNTPMVPLLHQHTVNRSSADVHTLDTIPEEPVMTVPDPIPPSPLPPFPLPPQPETAEKSEEAPPQPVLSPGLPSVPATTAAPRAASETTEAPRHYHEPSNHSGQKKHARVIEAATAPHPTHRNKHSKGYAALQAHLKSHVQAQKYSQAEALKEAAADHPQSSYNSGSSSGINSSGVSTGVLARLAPRSSTSSSGSSTSGMKMATTAGAIGLGSPTPARKVQLLTELSQQVTSSATHAPSAPAGASRTSTHDTSHYTTTNTSSTSTSITNSSSTSAVPGSHSALRLLLRTEQEQRRKTLPQTAPRFRSATSAYLAQAELQARQQSNRQSDSGDSQGRSSRGMDEDA